MTSLNREKEILVKDFDKIAEKLKREQNKIKFLNKKLKEQSKKEKREKDKNFDLDVLEIWETQNLKRV